MDIYFLFPRNDKPYSEIRKRRFLHILSRSSGVCVDFHFDGEVYEMGFWREQNDND